MELKEPPLGDLSIFLREVFYDTGSYYKYFVCVVQTVWLLILFLTSISGFLARRNDFNKKYAVIALAVIGLTMFELLFEGRARYLYTYISVYCVLAAFGLKHAGYLLHLRKE